MTEALPRRRSSGGIVRQARRLHPEGRDQGHGVDPHAARPGPREHRPADRRSRRHAPEEDGRGVASCAACQAARPGAADPDARRTTRPAGSTSASQMLGNRLGMPTYMENDANCAAWGEIRGRRRPRRRRASSSTRWARAWAAASSSTADLWIGATRRRRRPGPHDHRPERPHLRLRARRAASSNTPPRPRSPRSTARGSAKDCFDAAKKGVPEALAVVDWVGRGPLDRRGEHDPDSCILTSSSWRAAWRSPGSSSSRRCAKA